MDANQCPPSTVVIDWQRRTMSYRLDDDRSVQMRFLRPKRGGLDLFHFSCAVAIAQELHLGEHGITQWSGADSNFLGDLSERIGWRPGERARINYWSTLSRGRRGQRDAAEISFIGADGTVCEADECPGLFNNTTAGFLLGDYQQLPGGMYRLWLIEFRNADESFERLRGVVLDALGSGPVGERTRPIVREAAEPQSPRCSILKSTETIPQTVNALRHGSSQQSTAVNSRGVPGAQPISPSLRYLQPMTDIFVASSAATPEWFRRPFPDVADFTGGTVYRWEEKLSQLRDCVLSNPVSILEGEAATGKTVLYHHLALSLLQTHTHVYCFTLHGGLPFCPYRLAEEINSREGVFILDNAHLAPGAFAVVCSRLHSASGRHVLLVARPSLLQSGLREAAIFHRYPAIRLHLFACARQILDHFRSHHTDLPWDDTIVRDILSASEVSLWWLASCLRGFRSSAGNGDAREWLRQAVLADLVALEDSGDQHAEQYPRILVSLSPFYRDEVMVAEAFLVNTCHYHPAALQALVRQRWLTRDSGLDGTRYYGLPHSSLAKSYWLYGRTYRSERSYRPMLIRYALSEAPNCFEAAARTGITGHLLASGSILQVISQDKSSDAIGYWRITHADAGRLDHGTLSLLAEKAAHQYDPCDSAVFLQSLLGTDRQAASLLVDLIDWRRLASLLSVRRFCGTSVFAYLIFRSIGKSLAQDLMQSVDMGRLGWALSSDVRSLNVSILELLSEGLPSSVCDLCQGVDLHTLGNSVATTSSSWDIAVCLYFLGENHPQGARKLVNCVGASRLGDTFMSLSETNFIATAIWQICQIDGQLGKALVNRLVDLLPPAFEEWIPGSSAWAHAMSEITSQDQAAGVRLWRALGPRRIAARLDTVPRLRDATEVIYAISRNSVLGAVHAIECVDIPRLAAKCNDGASADEVIICLALLKRVSQEAATRLWSQIDRHAFGERLRDLEDRPRVHIWLMELANGAEQVAREVAELAGDGGKMAGALDEFRRTKS